MKHTLPRDITTTELSDLIDLHIIGFKAQRNREIIKAKFIEGLTYEQVAERFLISVQQAKTITYKGLSKLIKYM